MKRATKELICNLDFIIAGIALIGLVFLTVLGVVMRYFLNNPITWLEEVQMMLIVWLTMYGGSAVFRLRGHVAIEVIVDMCARPVRDALRVVVFFIVLGVLAFVVWNGAMLVMQLYGNERTTSVLGISYAFVYSAVPIGCTLMIINFVMAEICDFFGHKGYCTTAGVKE